MGPGGQPDLQQLMRQALAVQQQLATATAELSREEVTGSSGGGLVTVTMSGSGEVRSVKIAPEAVDRDDVETLEDLIVAALHAAAEEQRKLTERKLGPLAGGLPGLGGLPGMPGSPGG
ncbi:MAG: YbaB/EbfC family nucleoid-associated protein [Micromonosporaceae bacterium]